MMWKFHSKPSAGGNHHDKVSWGKGSSCSFSSGCPERQENESLLCFHWWTGVVQLAVCQTAKPVVLHVLDLWRGWKALTIHSNSPPAPCTDMHVWNLGKELLCYQTCPCGLPGSPPSLPFCHVVPGRRSDPHKLLFTLEAIPVFLQMALSTAGWWKSKKERHCGGSNNNSCCGLFTGRKQTSF